MHPSLDSLEKRNGTIGFEPITTIQINGDEWTIGYGYAGKTKGRFNDGLCVYAKKRIIINRRRVCSLLDVLAHEIIHARVPDLSETAVNDTAELIAKAYYDFDKRGS